MRSCIYLTIGAVFTLLLLNICFLTSACGSGQGGPGSPTGIAVSSGNNAQAQTAPSQAQALTAEDLRVLAMSYEDRLAYLQRKYRELVFELHGIVIDDDVGSSKATRSLDEEHRVEGDYNNLPPPDRDPPLEWKTQETVVEYINLQRDGDNWQWSLSFLERLYGDYNFSGRVTIADISPLAVHFNRKRDDGQWDALHDNLDRVANGDGRISIADITPIAQNFGQRLGGYNVYFLASGQYNWGNSTLIAEWRREDTGNWEDPGYRTTESRQTA